MPRAESKAQTTLGVTAHNILPTSTIMPNGKGPAAVPKLTDNEDNVEMKRMLPSGAEPDEDIMQLARLGDIHAIQKLFDAGKFDATYYDKEGITPLHVCAFSIMIN
jgi:palmitoyltransferase